MVGEDKPLSTDFKEDLNQLPPCRDSLLLHFKERTTEFLVIKTLTSLFLNNQSHMTKIKSGYVRKKISQNHSGQKEEFFHNQSQTCWTQIIMIKKTQMIKLNLKSHLTTKQMIRWKTSRNLLVFCFCVVEIKLEGVKQKQHSQVFNM